MRSVKSPTVVAELVFGGMRSVNPGDGIQRVNHIVRNMPIVIMNRNVGYGMALLKNRLVVSNELILENDIWIAATAMAYRMTLIARDQHFDRLVPYGLQFQQW